MKKFFLGACVACMLLVVSSCSFLGEITRTVFLETYQSDCKFENVTIAGLTGDLVLWIKAPTDTREFTVTAYITPKGGETRTLEIAKGTYTGDLTDTNLGTTPRATITSVLRNGTMTDISKSPHTLSMSVKSSNSFAVNLKELARMVGIDTSRDTRWNSAITFNSSLQNAINESR